MSSYSWHDNERAKSFLDVVKLLHHACLRVAHALSAWPAHCASVCRAARPRGTGMMLTQGQRPVLLGRVVVPEPSSHK